ncbi:hypothetical protein E2C01_078576 [Portunus trituberculatus]|uniref:Uncharacterized protein n=1 Tax=Portunus trituberculatus TaxID=210409 RepID=A0A5B7IQJ3_PORTR|nr:hypothetical protein [Portunus trituberculatus]
MEHFLLQCPRFHSHHTELHSWLSALAIITLDMPTLQAASGIHSSWQLYHACGTHTGLPQGS